MDNKLNPRQLELFADTLKNPIKKDKAADNAKTKSFSYQKTISYCICAIFILTFVFALGFRKGKSTVLNNQDRAKPIVSLPVKKLDNSKIVKKEIYKIQEHKNIPEVKKKIIQEPTFKYTIQVAVYRGTNYAQNELNYLKKNGFDAFMEQGSNFICIFVGKFLDKQKAQISLNQLKKRYKDCFIRRI